eukprot:5295012-Lingulodinium_polyedra.AAC.1
MTPAAPRRSQCRRCCRPRMPHPAGGPYARKGSSRRSAVLLRTGRAHPAMLQGRPAKTRRYGAGSRRRERGPLHLNGATSMDGSTP